MGSLHFLLPLRQVLLCPKILAGEEGLQAEVHEDGPGRGARRRKDPGEEWKNQGGGSDATQSKCVGRGEGEEGGGGASVSSIAIFVPI